MGIEIGLARAAWGIRRSSRVAMNITSVLIGKINNNNLRKMKRLPKRRNDYLKELRRRNTAQTDHWLFSADPVAGSELCRSSPRLRATRSSDRPNCKRREGSEFHTAPHPLPQGGGTALNQSDPTAVLFCETGQRPDNREQRRCAFLLAQQQNP